MARNHPTPIHARGGLRAGRPTIFRSPPVGAGHARPATSPPPAVNLPPLTHSPKPPDPATLLPLTPIICTRQPPSPQYTPCPNFVLKLCRKNQKNLQKPVDKGHTTCYNNQAVSRAQPAAAAAGATTACTPFLKKTSSKNFQKTSLDKRENLIYNIQAVTTRQRRTLKLNKTETCGTLIGFGNPR